MVNKNITKFLVNFLAIFIHLKCVSSTLNFIPKMRQAECRNRHFRGRCGIHPFEMVVFGKFSNAKTSPPNIFKFDWADLFELESPYLKAQIRLLNKTS